MSNLNPGKFWRLYLTLLVAALIAAGTGIAGAAQLPPLPEIPPALVAAHPDLVQRRAALGRERDTLRARTVRHNGQCQSVEEGSPEEVRCNEALDALREAVDRHIKECGRFITWLDSIRAPLPSFTVGISSPGEYYLVSADGRKVPGKSGVFLEIDNRTELVTGKDGVQILLPDQTIFTVGPDSDMVLDDFVYDPKRDAGKVTAELAKGIFRLMTGKVGHRIDPKIKLIVGTIGIRGTDVECFVAADGSGYLKLFSGAVVLTPKSGGPEIALAAGQMIVFGNSGIGAPVPIPGGV